MIHRSLKHLLSLSEHIFVLRPSSFSYMIVNLKHPRSQYTLVWFINSLCSSFAYFDGLKLMPRMHDIDQLHLTHA
jgi:hypothetical protein